ncbi:MAG: hypothetical protein DRP15_02155 [Candidatus Aenigmatarchaeota archaeon]|nr:MAG: hypothetical protein DRP15_02155 [Candidatus Aenigmarchaeota archaeon]
MVKLDRLVIQGFKSFRSRVSIPLRAGFSVITGPNGCGKSNIGDAISFVLGRGTSRNIRAKKAQELVFHGSETKPPCEFAKVTLYFDNSDGSFPIDEKIVSISRRVNTKGVSVYRINGKVVKRQEILDLLMQAGIYPNGHNIIQQGDVTLVVEMDPIERREIIDEISGIKEYDEKKQKALQELEKIAEKVREAEIILQEKHNILDRLGKEREVALRYKQLEEDLKKVRAALVWKEHAHGKKSLEEIEEKIKEKTKELEKLDEEIKKYDEKIKSLEENLNELTKSILRASDQIEVTKKLAKLRSEVQIKREKIDSARREIERIDTFIERLKLTDRSLNPPIKHVLELEGVHGVLSDLIEVPKEYTIAVEIAAGGHLNDVVVETLEHAVRCIKYLKDNKLGRVRFLPLDKLKPPEKKPLPPGAIGWVSELIHHDPKYIPAIEYVFSTTACVKDIDKAKEIAKKHRVRLVTLDGDLFEHSGAVTGGYYKQSRGIVNINKYIDEKKRLNREIEALEDEISKLNKEIEKLVDLEKKTETVKIERDRVKIDEELTKLRNERINVYNKKITINQEIGKLNIQKAKIEARLDDLQVRLEGEDKKYLEDVKDVDKGPEELKPFVDLEIDTLREKEKEIIREINSLGPVNMKALEDFDEIKAEFDDFKEKVDKIIKEKESIEDTINKIEEKKKTTFMHTMEIVAKNFKEVYKELTGGDAKLELENPEDINSGLLIKAQPPGKKLLHIDSMSGGEKTLTAFAFLFAIQRYKPSPFYILDEADSALDKVNTKKVVKLIKKHSKHAQFIAISHNDALISEADQIYGVSMEGGESKIIAIELPKEVAKEMSKNN